MYEEKTRSDKMKKIAFVTGSRADYGIMRRYLKLMNTDPSIDLKILVTGALLSDVYGRQIDLIYKDAFNIDVEIAVDLDSSSNKMILHTMAQTLDKFAIYFDEQKYDLFIILGDRYEMLSVATAAAIHKIPILHIHGGEATYGNYDEFIRHAITKMSLYHFTATEIYRERVIQLGEHPDRVYNLGALGAENCLFIEEDNVPNEIKVMNKKRYFVILFHPETLSGVNASEQISELLLAIKKFKEYQFVFLGSNADTHSEVIRDSIKKFVDTNINTLYYENLHTDAFHYLLKRSICIIGNSSSGIIEAPSLGIYTINIGDRQKGRVKGNSVINVKCGKVDISNAILKVLNSGHTIIPYNPYYRKNSAQLYYDTTKELLNKIDLDTMIPKSFYDMNPFDL